MASSNGTGSGPVDADASKETEISAIQFLQSPIVQVIVGQGTEAKSFPIYRDLLTAHSPFFRAALEGSNWKEGQDNIVKLEEESPQAFEVVVGWLFRDSEPTKYIDMNRCDSIVAAYKLANYLQMFQLKNDIVDHLRMHFKAKTWTATFEFMCLLDQAGMADEPIYEFCVKSWVWYYNKGTDIDWHDVNEGALYSRHVMLSLLKKGHAYINKKWDDPRHETGCAYHDHSDGSDCTTTRGVKRKHS